MSGEGDGDLENPAHPNPRSYTPYLEALLTADHGAALALAETLLEEGMPYRELCLTVIQPAMHEVGRLWQRTEISVAQEHMATAITQTVMARLFADNSPKRPDRSLIVCGTPGELHSLGARMIADFAQLEGWKTFYVGPSVPSDDLISLIEAKEPMALALSTSVPINLADAKACVAAVKDLHPDLWVIVGGRAYGGKREAAIALGADEFASDAGDFVRKLDARFG